MGLHEVLNTHSAAWIRGRDLRIATQMIVDGLATCQTEDQVTALLDAVILAGMSFHKIEDLSNRLGRHAHNMQREIGETQ